MATYEDFGAVGDGIADDRLPIYNALNSGQEIVVNENATYYIGSSIDVYGKNITIRGYGRYLFKNTSNINFRGTNSVSTTLKTNTLVNDSFIEVVNTIGFQVGSLISITTSQDFSWGYQMDEHYRMGELHEIVAIDGDKLYIDDKVWHNWTVGEYTIKVQQFTPITVTMSNQVFKYETPQPVSGGLIISYSKNNVLDKVVMHDATNIGIMFHYCYNNEFKNGAVIGSNSVNGGYGLRVQCSSKTNIHHSRFFKNFKSIESSTSPPTAYDYGSFPNRNLSIYSSYGCGCGQASSGVSLYSIGSRFLNTHAPSQNIVAYNNIIENFYTAFNFAGIDNEVYENTISGNLYHVISLIYGNNNNIHDNTIDGAINGSFVLLQDLNTGNVNIENNNVKTCKGDFITIGGVGVPDTVNVINNTVDFGDNISRVYSSINITNLTDNGNTIIGDYARGLNDFIINGNFISSIGWSIQSTWSISNGVASCTASSTNPTTGAIYQTRVGIRYYNNTIFEVKFQVLTGSGARIGVYSPVGGYVFKDAVIGDNIFEITSDGVYDDIVIINGGNVPFSMTNIRINIKT